LEIVVWLKFWPYKFTERIQAGPPSDVQYPWMCTVRVRVRVEESRVRVSGRRRKRRP